MRDGLALPQGESRQKNTIAASGAKRLVAVTMLASVIAFTEPTRGATILVVEAPAVVSVALMGMLGWRTHQGSRELTIRLAPTAIELHLPAYRSLSNPCGTFDGSVRLSDVRAIETRVETLSQFGVLSVTRTYRLVPRSGAPIFLFAEPLPWADVVSSQTKGMVEEMAAHAQLPLSDLGMVRSRPGILLFFRVRPAAWTVPSMNTAERQMTVVRLDRTAKIMPCVAIAVTVLGVLIGMFTH